MKDSVLSQYNMLDTKLDKHRPTTTPSSLALHTERAHLQR